MTQNVPLDTGDVAVEAFFDATQEMLSGAAVNFALTLLNPTTIRVPAGAGHDQVAISIAGQYRFVTANVDRAFPGGEAGTYDIFVTATANGDALAVPPHTPPGGDYSFALAIVADGATPVGAAIYRKVGALRWDGAAITHIAQAVGSPRPYLYGSATWDPGSIPAGGSVALSVNVPGATLGDWTLVSFSSFPGQSLLLEAQVSAASTVTVFLRNVSSPGTPIDMPVVTVRVLVLRH